MLRKDCASLPG
uniref:Uncharacterized protein n=1 Tax=Anguilla anguilla TaxID=7936 RepID=A0A0E9XZW5_ANGAN